MLDFGKLLVEELYSYSVNSNLQKFHQNRKAFKFVIKNKAKLEKYFSNIMQKNIVIDKHSVKKLVTFLTKYGVKEGLILLKNKRKLEEIFSGSEILITGG